MTRMLIVGPPGAGKGTQASLITSTYGIPDISTGDIFRANIKNETPLGVQVKAIVDAGGPTRWRSRGTTPPPAPGA